jgi:hypothetical protein
MTEATVDTTQSLPSEAQAGRDERIRLRAYELFLERKGGPGDAENDWYRAESEIAEQSGEKT